MQWKSIFGVWSATFASIGLSLSNVATLLQIGAATCAIGFTLWQWRRAKKKAKQEDERTL